MFNKKLTMRVKDIFIKIIYLDRQLDRDMFSKMNRHIDMSPDK